MSRDIICAVTLAPFSLFMIWAAYRAVRGMA